MSNIPLPNTPSGPAATAIGITMILAGLFIGGQLPRVQLLGFLVVLAGAMMLLFGVLTVAEDFRKRWARRND
jgi:uncharacterized membrane protein HdeD (DUF308 family)